MSDALHRLIALNTAHAWLNGARKVHEVARTVLAFAATAGDLAVALRDGTTDDWLGLERLLAANAGELAALDACWADQGVQVQAAADSVWPEIPDMARAGYAALLAAEQAEGPDSAAFAAVLRETQARVERQRESLADRLAYCRMVAEQAEEMDAAHVHANDALDEALALLQAAAAAAGPQGAAAAADIDSLSRRVRNRPLAVARAYRALARAAAVQAAARQADLHGVDAVLGHIYGRQGERILRDADDVLRGLYNAA
jgi:hypothetical protein